MKRISLAIALLLAAFLTVGLDTHQGAAVHSPDPYSRCGMVAIVVGEDLTYRVPLLQVRRLVEHQGLAYEIVRGRELSISECAKYSTMVVVGASQPSLTLSVDAVRMCVEGGAGLIWIGEDLPHSLYSLLGIREAAANKALKSVTGISYGNISTRVFNETLYPVGSAGAAVQGFFVDDADDKVAPAELSYREDEAAGLTYYFAYDVYSWWGADLEVPWLRAYRLQLALDHILSDHMMVRLAPYPRDLKAAFITRIEDVDPLHSDVEWMARAEEYLDYYSMRDAPLTVSVVPVYLEPSKDLRVELGADSAYRLRGWLLDVLVKGGTLVQHGFTHQYGIRKTGVASEFFDEEQGEWLPLEEQRRRISSGAAEIYSSLGFDVRGFEAPHYLANNDTYLAVSSLGFDYVTHNHDSPFFDRYGLDAGLINIPETLGYIPLNPSQEVEARLLSNMDMLYEMNGVILFMNHLFEDEALHIGQNLLDQALQRESVWFTDADTLAHFWKQRSTAYENMSVETDGRIRVTLGSSHKAGLTLNLNQEIKSVSVNGHPWPVFQEESVILPVLPKSSNVIIIHLSQTIENSNLPLGSLLLGMSTIFSVVLHRSLRSFSQKRETKGEREAGAW